LKVLIIRHFGLTPGDLGFRGIRDLSRKMETASTEKERLRFALEILGEAYDDWRHALEQDRRIQVTESWNAYEEILAFLEKQTWQGGTQGPESPESGRPTEAKAELREVP
jgi:hypothetical protein